MIDLKGERNRLSISQAQFAELSQIPQYKLSGYEHKKQNLSEEELAQIKDTLQKIENKTLVVRRKKRICKHVYGSSIMTQRPRRHYAQTHRNEEYRHLLAELSYRFKHAQGTTPTAISFFAGCGGLCYGIKAAGFHIVGVNELVKAYRDIYELNFGNTSFLSNDIRDIGTEELDAILEKYPNIDLLAGGPPCQGFSLAGKRDVKDDRNTLFQYYLKIAQYIRPKIILMENVKLLTSMKNDTGGLVKDDIIRTFTEIGYTGSFFIVNAKNYGVPQNRERVFFIGVRKGLNMTPSIPDILRNKEKGLYTKEYFSFGDATSDLEYLESGECAANDRYHKAVNHPEHVLRWLVDVPQGKSAHENADPGLRPPSGYNTTYKRQVWDEPAATITTNFNMISGCNNVHPIATRSLTIREAMRIQSFPDDFILSGKEGDIRTVIGNAVPPLLAYEIAKYLKAYYSLI